MQGDDHRSTAKSTQVENDCRVEESSNSVQILLPTDRDVERSENILGQSNNNLATQIIQSDEKPGDDPRETILENTQTDDPSACIQKSASMSNGQQHKPANVLDRVYVSVYLVSITIMWFGVALPLIFSH